MLYWTEASLTLGIVNFREHSSCSEQDHGKSAKNRSGEQHRPRHEITDSLPGTKKGWLVAD